MVDYATLAKSHMAQQVTEAATIQVALSALWDKTIDPDNLDASVALFNYQAAPYIGAGRIKSQTTAQTYFQGIKSLAGLDPAPILPLQLSNGAQVAASLSASTSKSIANAAAAKLKGVSPHMELASAKSNMLGSAKRQVLNSGRSTLVTMSEKDKDITGWARVSDGRPCPFCSMLVSRGPVYTVGSVGFRAHDRCGCSVRPVTINDTDKGWSPEALAYKQLWDNGGKADWKHAYLTATADGHLSNLIDDFKAKSPDGIAAAKAAKAASDAIEAANAQVAALAKAAALKAAQEAEEAALAAAKAADEAALKAAAAATPTEEAIAEWLKHLKSGNTNPAELLDDIETGLAGILHHKAIYEAIKRYEAEVAKLAKNAATAAKSAATKAANKAAKEALAAKLAKNAATAAKSAATKAANKAAKDAAPDVDLIEVPPFDPDKFKAHLGKPAPVKPVAPIAPEPVGKAAFGEWTDKVRARFTAYAKATGNAKDDLTKSLNWPLMVRVYEHNDIGALDQLKALSYIDDALYAEAKLAMAAAKVVDPDAAAAFKLAAAKHAAADAAHEQALADWREVNGITSTAHGMDVGLRHDSDYTGTLWANANLPTAVKDSVPYAAAKHYTTGAYRAWNEALRKHGTKPGVPAGAYGTRSKQLDQAMADVPVDLIVRRGTDFGEFEFNGTRKSGWPPPSPEDLVGTVQLQHGYTSTSVGATSAFGGEVKLRVLVPEGSKGAWVDPYSAHKGEREFILPRGSSFYIHEVYRESAHGSWVVEAEIVPDGVDATGWTPSPRATHER